MNDNEHIEVWVSMRRNINKTVNEKDEPNCDRKNKQNRV